MWSNNFDISLRSNIYLLLLFATFRIILWDNWITHYKSSRWKKKVNTQHKILPARHRITFGTWWAVQEGFLGCIGPEAQRPVDRSGRACRPAPGPSLLLPAQTPSPRLVSPSSSVPATGGALTDRPAPCPRRDGGGVSSRRRRRAE